MIEYKKNYLTEKEKGKIVEIEQILGFKIMVMDGGCKMRLTWCECTSAKLFNMF